MKTRTRSTADEIDDLDSNTQQAQPAPGRLARRRQTRADKRARKKAIAKARGDHPAIRRSIGVIVLAAMIFGIYYLVFQSELLTPVLAYATPAKEAIAWVKADPSRLMTTFALIAIPHLGMYHFFFERE